MVQMEVRGIGGVGGGVVTYSCVGPDSAPFCISIEKGSQRLHLDIYNLSISSRITFLFARHSESSENRVGRTVPAIMAGAKPVFRHLSRSSAHRRALLRNLVTSLIQHESIATTWHKAKEAQRMAEKLISLGKRNTPAARMAASKHLFVRAWRHEHTSFGEMAHC